MTGRYSCRVGVWYTILGRELLRRDEVTMANVFAANGYRTAIRGKWHLGDNYPFGPQDRGFEDLLTQYGPVAGIWLDGIGVTRSRPTVQFHVQELYNHKHRLQPQLLVAYKQGLMGTEDFLTPEHNGVDNPAGKPMEVNTTFHVGGWGYVKGTAHIGPDEVWIKLKQRCYSPEPASNGSSGTAASCAAMRRWQSIRRNRCPPCSPKRSPRPCATWSRTAPGMSRSFSGKMDLVTCFTL
jgi:hypothetical protein